MAKDITAKQTTALLKKAAALPAGKYEFILEICRATTLRRQYFVRLKGKNGQIIMHGEMLTRLQTARRIAARLIAGGLKAKLVIVGESKKKLATDAKAKPVKYPIGQE